ncbi:MAG: hypothetical protein Q8M59_15130 [Tabrizicola sp.]|uniref:hypothetical protein n=1 Tax=Tabrizicola sp. TaxID=2005166 RepID=UPI002733A2EA|nr:hypothetical protein [Tabrizicola sp.]MDP3264284.1 hypothetical protein [Tabrizicola sp.]
MKNVFLGAALAVCASASVTSASPLFGCELKKIVGSNAYYRSDVSCQFGAGVKDARVKASTPADPEVETPAEETPVKVIAPVETPDEPEVVDNEPPVTANDPVYEAPQPAAEDDVSQPDAPIVDEQEDPAPTNPPVVEEPAPTDQGVDETKPDAPAPEVEKPVKDADHDKGHGNDADGVDDDNPAQTKGDVGQDPDKDPGEADAEKPAPEKDMKDVKDEKDVKDVKDVKDEKDNKDNKDNKDKKDK